MKTITKPTRTFYQGSCKTKIKKLNFYWLFLLLFLSFGFMPSSYSQITGGPAVKANFGVDADVSANYQQFDGLTQDSGIDDWFFFDEWLGGGLNVIDQSNAAAEIAEIKLDNNYSFTRRMAVPENTTKGDYIWIDAVYNRDNNSTQSNKDISVFKGQSNKNGDNPTTWSLGIGGTPQKNDLIDTYGYLRRDISAAAFAEYDNGILWGYGGATTVSADGNSHTDFEFFRSDVTFDGSSLVNGGPDAGHTAWTFDGTGNIIVPGDILIAINFLNGGTVPDSDVRIWINSSYLANFNSRPDRPFDLTGVFDQGNGSGEFGYAEITEKTAALEPSVFAVVNVTAPTLGAPWGSLEGSQATYFDDIKALQFSEFAINLTALGLDRRVGTQDPCSNLLGSLLVKTRSSSSFTAELKDFSGPFRFGNITESELTVNCPTDPVLPSCSTEQEISAAFDLWKDGFTNVGGIDPVVESYTITGTGEVVDLNTLLPPDRCGGTISITYTVTDFCGNIETCSSTFTIDPDETAPVFAEAPADASYECIDDVPAPGMLAYTDNCDVDGEVMGVDVSDGNTCPETITRTWSFTDTCGNPASVSQTITVNDETAPVIIAPDDYTICNDELPYSIDATWTDNCDAGGNLTAYGVPYQSDECSETMSYTFTVTDVCGNMATKVVYVTREIETYGECETAFARYDDNNQCFIEDGFNRWGWTNKLSPSAEPYTLDLYAGAGQCDVAKGTKVGEVIVTYNNGKVTVEYDIFYGYSMSEAHVYIGCEPYPTKNGKQTVAPGQFTFNAGKLDHASGIIVSSTPEQSVSGDIYVIAHAVTCELICKCSEPSNGAEPEMFNLDINLDCVSPSVNDVAELNTAKANFKAYPVPFIDILTVEYKYEYDTDVKIQVFDAKGMLIINDLDNRYIKGEIGTKNLDLSRVSDQTLIIRLVTNKEKMSKMVIAKSIDKR